MTWWSAAQCILSRSLRIGLGLLLLMTLSWLCFEAMSLASGNGSGRLYLGWFAALTGGGFASGVIWPRCTIWGALLITWTQSLFVYHQLAVSGEIEHPGRSTGGMVTWAIPTIFLVLFSPVPAAASWVGRRLRRKFLQRGEAADHGQVGEASRRAGVKGAEDTPPALDHGGADGRGPLHLADPVLPAPWLRVDADTAKKLANELARELGPGHVLAGVAAVGFARRDDCDDVIYQLHGHASQFAIVHLKWHRASRPEWPWATLFAGGDDLVAHCQSDRE